MKTHVLLAALCFFGCDANKKDTSKVVPSTANGDAATDGRASEALTLSEATLTGLTYDAKSHSLLVGLDYAGCGRTTHSLRFGDICAESYPRQCGAALERPKSYDTSCLSKTLNHEDLAVNLRDDQDAMVLRVANSKGESMQVLIDRTGKVGAATTPP